MLFASGGLKNEKVCDVPFRRHVRGGFPLRLRERGRFVREFGDQLHELGEYHDQLDDDCGDGVRAELHDDDHKIIGAENDTQIGGRGGLHGFLRFRAIGDTEDRVNLHGGDRENGSDGDFLDGHDGGSGYEDVHAFDDGGDGRRNLHGFDFRVRNGGHGDAGERSDGDERELHRG